MEFEKKIASIFCLEKKKEMSWDEYYSLVSNVQYNPVPLNS